MEMLASGEVERIVTAALEEDLGSGDATTISTIAEDSVSEALMKAREPIVVSGLALAEAAFRKLSIDLQCERGCGEGEAIEQNQTLLTIRGPTRAILGAERVALNFVQRLSGIATMTARFVKEIRGTRAQILDTRKTTPLWRRLEKYAVRCGGGKNHRTGLFDMILIKDNHLSALRDASPNAVTAAVQRARSMFPGMKIEVEADTLDQVRQALEARADMILLDNMRLEELREAVRIVNGAVKLEASGGVDLGTIRAIAETGVDFVSVGALTHSVRCVDIALDFL